LVRFWIKALNSSYESTQSNGEEKIKEKLPGFELVSKKLRSKTLVDTRVGFGGGWVGVKAELRDCLAQSKNY
jgi:hypothetical protein